MLSAHICAQRMGRVCYGLGCSLFKTWSPAAPCFRTLELSWTSREEEACLETSRPGQLPVPSLLPGPLRCAQTSATRSHYHKAKDTITSNLKQKEQEEKQALSSLKLFLTRYVVTATRKLMQTYPKFTTETGNSRQNPNHYIPIFKTL